MKRVMMFNGKRQETYQVEMMEFSLDEKYEEMLMEKAVKFVQYCHVLMKARNKLRHEKIKLFKNQIWDSYEQKGLLFTVTYQTEKFLILSQWKLYYLT